jgi:SAM-dependent methyltransferase
LSDKLGLEDAYGVKTPDDNLRLYAKWAGTYEDDFVAANGYVLHRRVADTLAQHLASRDGPILDVGCGTGVGGLALAEHGFSAIDGVDLSAAMLEVARHKRTKGGSPVYRALFEADLTRPLKLSNAYAGIVSAGTFTHGHLGPESLGMLWRIAAPACIGAIGINASHYATERFSDVLAAQEVDGRIEIIDIVEVDIYRKPPADLAPGNDRAKIAVLRIVRI